MPRVLESVDELRALVGQEVGASDWLEVTQAMINAFADTTHDHQWIHVNPDRARVETPFGTTIAHGFLTLSLMSHLASQAFQIQGGFRMGINYGLNRVRFTAPVPSGSRIRARYKLQNLEDIPQGIQVIWAVTVEVEGAPKPSLVAEWVLRWYYA